MKKKNILIAIAFYIIVFGFIYIALWGFEEIFKYNFNKLLVSITGATGGLIGVLIGWHRKKK